MVAGHHSFGHVLGYRGLDEHRPLEADLAQRSTAALKDTILDKRRISVAGRDVTLAADAFSEDGRQSAVASVEAVPGVRWLTMKPGSFPKPSRLSGRPNATSFG